MHQISSHHGRLAPRRLLPVLRVCIASAILCAACLPAAQAADGSQDIRSIFCPAISDETEYDRNRFHAYKMLVPGEDGWIFRTQSDLESSFDVGPQALANIRDMNRALESRGIDLVMFFIPPRGLVHHDKLEHGIKQEFGLSDADAVWENYHKTLQLVREQGVDVVSMERPSPDEPFYYRRDHHWNPQGARKGAAAIAAHIRELPIYESLQKRNFITKDLGPYDFVGVSRKVFKRLCGTTQPPEEIVRQVTEPASEADSEDLFGEASDPPVVLLGTSNSTPEPSLANFHGALQELLSLDILNMAVSGGGFGTALQSYLNSDFYSDSPAQIAIWEIPAYYDLDAQNSLFREAIPAVYGDCGEAALAEASGVGLSSSPVVALERLRRKKIAGSDHYIYLEFSQPVRKSFRIDLRYTDDRDRYRFSRPSRYPHDGKFYLRLKQDKKSALDKVVLSVPKSMKDVTVNVKICRMPLPQQTYLERVVNLLRRH